MLTSYSDCLWVWTGSKAEEEREPRQTEWVSTHGGSGQGLKQRKKDSLGRRNGSRLRGERTSVGITMVVLCFESFYFACDAVGYVARCCMFEIG